MEKNIEAALSRGGIADITTTGRKSGLPRKIEIYFHQIDGDYYLTGHVGRKRDWEANIKTNPQFTLHLKRGVEADVPVIGETESDPEVRGRILYRAIVDNWDGDPEKTRAELSLWVDQAPFIRFRPVEI